VNLPNRITLARLVLGIGLFVLLVFIDLKDESGLPLLITAFFLFIAVVATDALDGYYARKYQLVSDFGRIADPAVDKIVVCGTMIFLCAEPWARPMLHPWMVVLIIAREFLVAGLRGFIEAKGIAFGAESAGKLKMVAQCVAVPAVFFAQIVAEMAPAGHWAVGGSLWLARALVWTALVLTVWSGMTYTTKAARILRTEP
jgi:CDP-diacylglycerol--glycerol-3-phosphate 3-phosphatidyltransferase